MPNEITSNDEIRAMFPGIRAGDEMADVRFVPTPLSSLNNIIFGCGGVPRGRTIELYAAPSAGKTQFALNLCAWYQGQQLRCAWDDREGTFPNEEYTKGIGLDRSALTMMDTADGNDACYQFELMAALNFMDLYVIDSATMMIPKDASITADTEDPSMHQKLQRAVLLTSFFSKLRSGYVIGKPGTFNKKKGEYNKSDLIKADKKYFVEGKWTDELHKLSDKDVTLIMINHMKNKIGVRFGDKTSTPGGDATKFDASLRLKITYKKKSKEKSKGKPLYKICEIKAEKNKVAPPFGTYLYRFWLDGHIDEYGAPGKEANDDDIEDVTQEDFE